MMNSDVIERHIISVLVDNEPGVLARVIGLFSGRGYNIESLTVAEVDTQAHLSRISIVTSGTPMVIEQIKAQLARLVPIHSVCDLTEMGASIERELALVKIINSGDDRIEALRIADTFRARTLDSTLESFVFEITGTSSKVAAFTDLMKSLGEVEISRTGVSAISRGNRIDYHNPFQTQGVFHKSFGIARSCTGGFKHGLSDCNAGDTGAGDCRYPGGQGRKLFSDDPIRGGA